MGASDVLLCLQSKVTSYLNEHFYTSYFQMPPHPRCPELCLVYFTEQITLLKITQFSVREDIMLSHTLNIKLQWWQSVLCANLSFSWRPCIHFLTIFDMLNLCCVKQSEDYFILRTKRKKIILSKPNRAKCSLNCRYLNECHTRWSKYPPFVPSLWTLSWSYLCVVEFKQSPANHQWL